MKRHQGLLLADRQWWNLAAWHCWPCHLLQCFESCSMQAVHQQPAFEMQPLRPDGLLACCAALQYQAGAVVYLYVHCFHYAPLPLLLDLLECQCYLMVNLVAVLSQMLWARLGSACRLMEAVDQQLVYETPPLILDGLWACWAL